MCSNHDNRLAHPQFVPIHPVLDGRDHEKSTSCAESLSRSKLSYQARDIDDVFFVVVVIDVDKVRRLMMKYLAYFSLSLWRKFRTLKVLDHFLKSYLRLALLYILDSRTYDNTLLRSINSSYYLRYLIKSLSSSN
jgi:hypothetical protein